MFFLLCLYLVSCWTAEHWERCYRLCVLSHVPVSTWQTSVNNLETRYKNTDWLHFYFVLSNTFHHDCTFDHSCYHNAEHWHLHKHFWTQSMMTITWGPFFLFQLWENAVNFWTDLQHYRELFCQDGLNRYGVHREAQVSLISLEGFPHSWHIHYLEAVKNCVVSTQ